MNNTLSVFNFESNEIRFVDGKPVANDVARVLGYVDPVNTIRKKVDLDCKGVAKRATLGGENGKITKGGIMSSIFSLDYKDSFIRYENREGEFWICLSDMAQAENKEWDVFIYSENFIEFSTRVKKENKESVIDFDVKKLPDGSSLIEVWGVVELAVKLSSLISVELEVWILPTLIELIAPEPRKSFAKKAKNNHKTDLKIKPKKQMKLLTAGLSPFVNETVDVVEEIRHRMLFVPSGSFKLGETGSEYVVKVENFFIGRYLVTQSQWRVIADLPKEKIELDPDPSWSKDKDNPVDNVSWYQAIEFCARLSKYTNKPYRLPSEAEWEYIYRSEAQILKKGQQSPKYVQEWERLEDISDNIFEWCADPWGWDHINSSFQNKIFEHTVKKTVPSSVFNNLSESMSDKRKRVMLSGDWGGSPSNSNPICRTYGSPQLANSHCGFRLAMSYQIHEAKTSGI